MNRERFPLIDIAVVDDQPQDALCVDDVEIQGGIGYPVCDLAADQRSICRFDTGVDQGFTAAILAGELVVFDLDKLLFCIVNVGDGSFYQV